MLTVKTSNQYGVFTMSQKYSNEDLQELLRQATILQEENNISREQLIEIAAEVGISAETIEKAEQKWLRQRESAQKQAKARSHRRLGFQLHLIPYLATSVFMVLLNLTTTPRCFWSIYPILGWGLGVTLHGACIYRKEVKLS
jgi:threonyl-tRNA synthetase